MDDLRIEPISGAAPPFVAGTGFDLADVGYTEAEYAISGVSKTYRNTADGVKAVDEAEFATRILVYRPVDDSLFNGTVWVEWLNVSGGLDAAPSWIHMHRQLTRMGAAWVGVSAQKVGVDGGNALLQFVSGGLTGADPERYGSLHHPGDRFSFDIFSKASKVARNGSETILESLPIDQLIATGDSQSAYRLTTYVNEIDPSEAIHDGFMVHSRGAGAPGTEEDEFRSGVLEADPVLFRDDLRVPVFCVETETDLISLRYKEARQNDSEMLSIWELAGTSHADVYTFVAGRSDSGLLTAEELAPMWIPHRDLFGMSLDKPVNAGPQHYLRNAAALHLDRWVREKKRPPASPLLEIDGDGFVTDADGTAMGGVRTPHTEVPTSVLSGVGNSGAPISFLCGSTSAISPDELLRRYRSKSAYLERFAEATDAAVAQGFFVAEDAAEIIEIADYNCTF